MAKTLNERIESARSTDRVTITDLEALIADTRAERDRLVGAGNHHAQESINLAFTDEDREESDRLAQHCTRTAKAYSVAIDELDEKLTAKRSSERRRAEEEERAARIARRDDLASRLAHRMPALLAELSGLLAEIEASDAEMRGAGSAEAKARGIPENFYVGATPVSRVVSMKIPIWGSHGLAWPIDRRAIELGRIEEANRRRLVASERQMKAEAARWKLYLVEAPGEGGRITIKTRHGPKDLYRNTVETEMAAEGVAEARASGCKVNLINKKREMDPPAMAEFIA